MPEARAILRFVRVTPRKARAVVDLIRGQQVPHALSVLKYTPRLAAKVVEKLLRSAVANAELKELGQADTMRVSRAFVDCGPIYKRSQPRAQGRAFAIHKRTSHITLFVEAPEVIERPKAGRAGKAAAKAPKPAARADKPETKAAKPAKKPDKATTKAAKPAAKAAPPAAES
jgi:large subunit ribosomal protein L22